MIKKPCVLMCQGCAVAPTMVVANFFEISHQAILNNIHIDKIITSGKLRNAFISLDEFLDISNILNFNEEKTLIYKKEFERVDSMAA